MYTVNLKKIQYIQKNDLCTLLCFNPLSASVLLLVEIIVMYHSFSFSHQENIILLSQYLHGFPFVHGACSSPNDNHLFPPCWGFFKCHRPSSMFRCLFLLLLFLNIFWTTMKPWFQGIASQLNQNIFGKLMMVLIPEG